MNKTATFSEDEILDICKTLKKSPHLTHSTDLALIVKKLINRLTASHVLHKVDSQFPADVKEGLLVAPDGKLFWVQACEDRQT